MSQPIDFEAIRKQVGVRTQEVFAAVLGITGSHYRRLIHKTEPREPSETLRRLAEAYRDGYRPRDWPTF